MFTRHHGRIALVAKGAKRPSSNFRPVLLPLQPLRVAFGGDAEIRTLKGAEWVGGQVMPTGDALLSGYYLNELLLRLLARDDPHPALFDAYAGDGAGAGRPSTARRCSRRCAPSSCCCCARSACCPSLDAADRHAGAAGRRRSATAWCPKAACVEAARADDRGSLTGAQWLALQAALDDPAPFARHAARRRPRGRELKPQLRALLHYHCGVATLRTRQLMMDLQAL